MISNQLPDMLTPIFFKGFGIGFTVAAVIGPIGILCIRRTLSDGQAVGLAIGLGAALADATYSLIAGFGLTFIANFMLSQQVLLHFVGGIFLLYLGFKTFRDEPTTHAATVSGTGLIGTAFSTFFLTLTNPMTIISFAAIFAALGIDASNYASGIKLVSGVFLGSALWFILLTTFLSFFHKKIGHKGLNLINKISGSIIIGFGLLSIGGILIKRFCL
jgi:threonine/homoserine/homoserine lactone efflux protein